MKRFQRSIAPDAAHDQSAHPSVSAGEAPSSICIGTTPDGHDGPLTQYRLRRASGGGEQHEREQDGAAHHEASYRASRWRRTARTISSSKAASVRARADEHAGRRRGGADVGHPGEGLEVVPRHQSAPGAGLLEHAEPPVHETDDGAHGLPALVDEQDVFVADAEARNARHFHPVVAHRPAEELQLRLAAEFALERADDLEGHHRDDGAARRGRDPA